MMRKSGFFGIWSMLSFALVTMGVLTFGFAGQNLALSQDDPDPPKQEQTEKTEQTEQTEQTEKSEQAEEAEPAKEKAQDPGEQAEQKKEEAEQAEESQESEPAEQQPAVERRRPQRGGQEGGRFGGRRRGGGQRPQMGQGNQQPGAQQGEEGGEKKIADPILPNDWVEQMQWRSIGPANMSGRITDIAVYEADPNIWYIASASGGLVKTTNGGMTFEHQFDHEATVSIGDVEVSKTDPNLVWVGTGESNPRNSVSWGNGVYKSTDGGKTWTHMGLDKTFQIGEIRIHPENPDIVYVGALGRLWGPNEERGLYKTDDGGKTWKKIFYVDEKTGVIDIDLKPDDPNTLIIATYERQRDGFDENDPAKKWGPGSGLYKSTDAGQTWAKITDGIPSGELGRIGVDWYRSDPNVIYALVESEHIGDEPENAPYAGIQGQDAEVGARLTEIVKDGPAETAGLKNGDIVIELAGEPVLSYDGFIASIRKHLAGDTVEIKVSRDRKPVTAEITFTKRPGAEEDTEETEASRAERQRSQSPFRTWLGGQVPNVQDQQGPDGDQYGGVYVSEDAGDSWKRINSLNPRPMYFSEIRVDPSDRNYVYVLGIPLFRSSDGGKTFTDDGARGDVHVDHHAMWVNPEDGRNILLGNDGGLYETRDRMENWEHINRFAIGQFYHVGIGPRTDYMVYGGLQDNGSWGGPSRVGRGRGPRNSDWFRIGGGDGFVCLVDPDDPDQVYAESQNGGFVRYNLRTGESGWMRARAPRGERFRFNWKTPFILSHHNSKVYYTAGNYVLKSLFKGNDLDPISPEISNTDQGSGTALSESPLDANVLYVGTNDGAVWRTRDGGMTWERLFGAQPNKEKEKSESTETSEGEQESAAESAEKAESGEQVEPGEEKATEEEKAADEPVRAEEGDPITGTWKGASSNENIPGGQFELTIAMKLEKDNKVTGDVTTRMGSTSISEGNFDPETHKLQLQLQRDEMRFEVEGTLDPDTGQLKGVVTMGGGRFTIDFTAKRESVVMKPAEEEAGSEVPDFVKKLTIIDLATDVKEGEQPPSPMLKDLVPGPRWVSSLEASRFERGRVYITLDGHRSDDDKPYVFVSEDYGTTWRSLTANLPDSAGSTRVVREDIRNPNVLYLGCEFSAWVSVDRGETWTSLNSNLPTVAVHEIAQHPTRGEIVAGTHGRSLWILDVTPIRQMTKEAINQTMALYRPNTTILWRDEPSSGETLQAFEGENPEFGARIWYSFRENVGRANLVVKDITGEVIQEFDVNPEQGLHSVRWDLRREPVGRQRRGPRVEPGTYLVELSVGGEKESQPLEVRGDPDSPEVVNWGVEYDEMLEEMERASEEGEESGVELEPIYH